MAVFLDRASQDFPRHDAFQTISTAPAEGNLAAVILWAQVAVSFIYHLASSDPVAAARWYVDIQTLAANHPEDAALREPQAGAAFNLFLAYVKSGDKAGEKQMVADILRLAAENPGLSVCQEAVERLASILKLG